MINYQLELDKLIQKLEIQDKVPKLFIHSCCAPCSTYVIEYLSQYFELTVFYYNPNIWPRDEYQLRAKEQRRLIKEMTTKYPVQLLVGDYEPDLFFEGAKGLEQEPECGSRCSMCYELRLQKTGEMAVKYQSDFFATTLTISPMKKSKTLNDIGERIAEEVGVTYLSTDFKKKGGFQRSTVLSEEYNLYRQNFCGCIYSKIAMEKVMKQREEHS